MSGSLRDVRAAALRGRSGLRAVAPVIGASSVVVIERAKRSWDGGLNPSPAARTLAKLVRGVADNVVDRLSRSARSRWHRRRALTTDERSSDARLRLRLGLFALRGSFSRTELAERIRTHVQEPTWVVMERERVSRFATPACRALAATAGTRGTPSPPSGSPQ
jgi:hypothetical protein